MNCHKLIDAIAQINPLQKNYLSQSLKRLSKNEHTEFNILIERYLSRYQLSLLAESYNTIVQDTLSEQIYFRKNKNYRYASFEEVANNVYFSDIYMKKYMIGLALTQYLWPSHVELKRFFENTIPKDRSGSYLEIGPGHGQQVSFVSTHTKYSKLFVCDISETSLELTKESLKMNNVDCKNINFMHADFLTFNFYNKFDCLIMGEVLEHVERPDLFLKKIKEITKPTSHIYITTCINAPAVDHIYLFSNTEEITEMCINAGLNIFQELIIPYEGKTTQQCEDYLLPINVGYILKHARS